MKSRKDIPPAHFSSQFKKDLLEANELSQINWIFDKFKLDDIIASEKAAGRVFDFEETMKKAIDELDIPRSLWQRYNARSAKDMKNKIKGNFENIFSKI